MNVASVFGFSQESSVSGINPHVVGVTKCGVEIELEGVTDRSLRSPYWEVKNDGSLRNNGVEFVNDGPQGGQDLFNACVDLDSFLQDKNPDSNWRCSTHVHVDVRDMDSDELKRFILAYIVYEKLLFRLSGMHRYSNNFCFAVGFAQQMVEHLATCWSYSGDRFMSTTVSGWDKYSAMNLLPMSRFGSLEFRSSAAEWRRGKLLRLCNRFLSLRELAKNWQGTEEEMVGYLASTHPRDVMGKGLPKVLPPEWEEDIAIGIKLAFDILFVAALPEAPRRGLGIPEPLRMSTPRHGSPRNRIGRIASNRVFELLRSEGSYNLIAYFDGEQEIQIPFTTYTTMLERLQARNVRISGDARPSQSNSRNVVVTASFIEGYCERVSRDLTGLVANSQRNIYEEWKAAVTDLIDFPNGGEDDSESSGDEW